MGIFGWRGRLGLIIPNDNVVVEPELRRIIPDGVSIHSLRLERNYLSMNSNEMLRSVKNLLDSLGNMVNVAAYCCIASSASRGLKWNTRLIDATSRNNFRATTAAISALKALNKMEVRRVALVSLYSYEKISILRNFFREGGVKVTSFSKIEPPPSLLEINRTSSGFVYGLAKKTHLASSDGIFIAGTNLRGLDVVSILEADLGKTVISANQAILWELLELAEIREKIKGCGSLLE